MSVWCEAEIPWCEKVQCFSRAPATNLGKCACQCCHHDTESGGASSKDHNDGSVSILLATYTLLVPVVISRVVDMTFQFRFSKSTTSVVVVEAFDTGQMKSQEGNGPQTYLQRAHLTLTHPAPLY